MNQLNSKDIILKINDDSYMQMTAERPLYEVCMCDYASLILHHPQIGSLCIKPASKIKRIFDILTTMRLCFEDALAGKLELIQLPYNWIENLLAEVVIGGVFDIELNTWVYFSELYKIMIFCHVNEFIRQLKSFL